MTRDVEFIDWRSFRRIPGVREAIVCVCVCVREREREREGGGGVEVGRESGTEIE